MSTIFVLLDVTALPIPAVELDQVPTITSAPASLSVALQ
jgi:hypothetical protein